MVNVETEHEIVITRHGKSIARLLPVRVRKQKPSHRELRNALLPLKVASEILQRDEREQRQWACVYVDTSALAKWYLPETRSEAFSDWILPQRDTCISSVTVTELRCLLARRRGMEKLNDMRIFKNLRAFLAGYPRWPSAALSGNG